MRELLYVTPPQVQTGKLLSARVVGAWADDAIWLDGIAKGPRMVRDSPGWCAWEDTGGAEKIIWQWYDCKYHANLAYKVNVEKSGAGTCTLKIKYKTTTILTATANAESTYDVSALAGAWEVVLIQVTMTTTDGTDGRIKVDYMEHRPTTATGYVTPYTFADAAVPTAANFNTIATAITGLNTVAKWPVVGLTRFSGGPYGAQADTTVKTWKHFHHGTMLYYRVFIGKDGSNTARYVKWRIKYGAGADEVATGSYHGAHNMTDADGTGWYVCSGSASLAGLANQNALVDVVLSVEVYGATDAGGKGWIICDYVFTVDQSDTSIPGRIIPTQYAYGDTGGQTATLDRIAGLLRDMANDAGGGYNASGLARMLARSCAVPVVTPRKRFYMVHSGWPTLRYRAKNATMHWGSPDQSQALTDWPPTLSSEKSRALTLTGLKGLSPGMAYYIESTSFEIHGAWETRE